MPSLLVISGLTLSLLGPGPSRAEPAAAGHRAAQAGESAPELAAHERLLEELRKSDSVLPPQPAVHPLRTMYNREAIIPPMCYTRTEGKHNPCYVCHQDRIKGRPNAMNDGDLQTAYSFSELGRTNHHRNLFVDRRAQVAAISDEAILAWIAEDNYSELAPRLREAQFKGFVPDLEKLARGREAFDDEGFAKDGSHWVAFNYKPLPSTFWPTNGSTDDVMIRLPLPFRTTSSGAYSRDVYKANLALAEANAKDLEEITVRNLDERAIGEDLNGDGKLTAIDRITRTRAGFVGAAKGRFVRPYMLPLDTEFLHSVRYVGVTAEGLVYPSPRMKELRYMRKHAMLTEPQLYEEYLQEGYAKEAGHLPGYRDRGPYGLDNELGWVLAGFIENSRGRLRFNTFEENMQCMGCHTSVGATIDSTFSFVRKVDGAAGWGYVDLRGMPDAPNRGETAGEIATYLDRAGGGGEFRSNPEMQARWFRDGKVDREKVARAKDVYELIVPSPRRALELNKAYRLIVAEQAFLYGRDASLSPPVNVYEAVDPETAPTLPETRTHRWDIRLDWSRAQRR